MKFKIGDRVRLNQESRYAHQNDGEGTVIDIDHYDPSLPFMVEWDKAKRGEDLENYYAAADLLRVRKPKPKKPAGKRVDAVVYVRAAKGSDMFWPGTVRRTAKEVRGLCGFDSQTERIARCRLVEVPKKRKVKPWLKRN